MSVLMKTFHFKTDMDIREILVHNEVYFNNTCEIICKNIKKKNKVFKKKLQMDFVVMEAEMENLKIQNDSSVPLTRLNNQIYDIIFINVKNESGKYFSSLIDHLCEDDRILITTGSVARNSVNKNRLRVLIRPEQNSLVFLLKYDNLIVEKSISFVEKNLSKLHDTGIYSIFGFVKKIMKYIDEKYMLIRMQCSDKSCIKTRKYPHHLNEFKNVALEEKKFGLKYDFCSKEVDILVKYPCIDFTNLVPNQRIVLYNIKVKCSNDLNIFLLSVKGNKENLKADPIEINSKNSLRPPERRYEIPDDLKPANKFKKKQITSKIELVSKFKSKRLNNKILSNAQQSNIQNVTLDYSSDDNDDDDDDDDVVNASPCQDFITFSHNKNKVNDGASCSYDTNNTKNSCALKKRFLKSNKIVSPLKKSLANVQQNDSDMSDSSSSSSSVAIDILSYQVNSTSPNDSNDKITNDGNDVLQENRVNNDQNDNDVVSLLSKTSGNVKRCIGPCRLVYIEPYIVDDSTDDDILAGYCSNCLKFRLKCYLKTTKLNSEVQYKCPVCENVVYLTFFFKMNFLYGNNENQAIEVCCYNNCAENVIKKLTKTADITIQNYLLNHEFNKKIIANTFKLLICKKIKLNIVVCNSPVDNLITLITVNETHVIT